jgi:hypothetical protein
VEHLNEEISTQLLSETRNTFLSLEEDVELLKVLEPAVTSEEE